MLSPIVLLVPGPTQHGGLAWSTCATVPCFAWGAGRDHRRQVASCLLLCGHHSGTSQGARTEAPTVWWLGSGGGGEGRDSPMWSSEAQPSQAERADVLPPEDNDPDSLVLLITIEFPNLIPRFKCN